MESPAPASLYSSRNSKKRVNVDATSSSMWCADVEVFEAPPPDFGSSKNKPSKRKEVISHEIIDLGEASDDEPLTNGDDLKGKAMLPMYLSAESLLNDETGNGMFTSVQGSGSGLVDLNGGDAASTGLFFKEDEWLDSYYDDIVFDDDDYYDNSVLKFDKVNVPAGVEVEFPLLPSPGNLLSSGFPSVTEIGPHSSSTSFSIGKPTVPMASAHLSSDTHSKGLKTPWKHIQATTKTVSNYLKYSWGPSGYMVGNGDKIRNWMQEPPKSTNAASSTGTPGSSIIEHRDIASVGVFKKFDAVEDCSDHYFFKNGSPKLKPKNWAKRVQDEWKILQNDLPDKIYVRVYESRMDLLRAVIIGAEGTPYHDGLFFFDISFPNGYPKCPPVVHYYSGGLRINPNLYNCGKVCLSLLHTWSGDRKEKWIPGVSTMLQVLVSIQALILNAKPYFNEPGFEYTRNSPTGEKRSLDYNEKTFVYSLQTMVYSMRRPPKHFEDLVIGHFRERARHILVSCKAYLEGAQVGSLVEGGIQDVDEGDKSCSGDFKVNLSRFIGTLISSFMEIGAKDCDQFLNLAAASNQVK